jgi:hypothetical protein
MIKTNKKYIILIISFLIAIFNLLTLYFSAPLVNNNNTKERNIYILVTNAKILGKGSVELYNALKKDNHNVKIISIPFYYHAKKNQIAYQEDNKFLKNFLHSDIIRPCNYLNDTITCEDIKFNKNDIVFTQSPYPGTWDNRPTQSFDINNLAKKCKVAYIAYDSKIFHVKYTKRDLSKIVTYLFAENTIAADIFHKEYNIPHNNIIISGFPEYNTLRNNISLTYQKKNTFIWMPRWAVDFKYRHYNETGSTFLNYYNFFYNYLKNNPDINMILRPHPALFDYLVQNKSLTQDELDNIINKFKQLPNFELSNENSLAEDIQKAKFVISDHTSSLAQVAIGKLPIIYLSDGYDKIFESTELSKKIFKHIYLAQDPIEIEENIKKLKKNNYQINGNIKEYNEFLKLLDPVDTPSAKISEYLKNN